MCRQSGHRASCLHAAHAAAQWFRGQPQLTKAHTRQATAQWPVSGSPSAAAVTGYTVARKCSVT
jgi:hypothetical protein